MQTEMTQDKNGYVTIYKSSYLKTPLYSWDYTNSVGGGGNNSGMHRSLKSCVKHCKANLRVLGLLDMKVLVIETHGYDEHDKAVTTSHMTIFSKLNGALEGISL